MSRLSYSESRDGLEAEVSDEGDSSSNSHITHRRSRGRGGGSEKGDGMTAVETAAHAGGGGQASPGTESISSYSLMGLADVTNEGGLAGDTAEGAGSGAPDDTGSAAPGDTGGASGGEDEVRAPPAAGAAAPVRRKPSRNEKKRLKKLEMAAASAAEAVAAEAAAAEAAAATGVLEVVDPNSPPAAAAEGSAAAPLTVETGDGPLMTTAEVNRKPRTSRKAHARQARQQEEGDGGYARVSGGNDSGGDEKLSSKSARQSAVEEPGRAASSDNYSKGGGEGGGDVEGSDDDAFSDSFSVGGFDGDDHQGYENDEQGNNGGDVAKEGASNDVPEVTNARSVGQAIPEEMKLMAESRLSKWALKFTAKRTYVPPAIPVIEPTNDLYLASFGRSYAEAKARAGKNHVEQAESADGEGGGNDSDTDPSVETDGPPSLDAANGDVGGGSGGGTAAAAAAAGATAGTDAAGSRSSAGAGGTAAAPAPASGATSPRSNLSAGRKKHGVYVRNLPYSLCDETRLEDAFSRFGRITAVVLTRPPEGRAFSGGAKLFFSTAEEAQRAVDADGIDLLGRSVGVSEVWSTGGGGTPARYFVEPEEAAKAVGTIICANCSKPGHRDYRCPLPATRCTLCGAFGHDDKNCAFNACTRCFNEGHLADACPDGEGMELAPEPCCALCGKGGHAIDTCSEAGRGRNQLKFSCATCRDDGHTDCRGEMLTIMGNERGNAMTCYNCGLDDHSRRACRYQTEEQVLREFGYFDCEAKGGLKRRRSAGAAGGRPCYNCNQLGHRIAECKAPKQTQTPNRYGTSSRGGNGQNWNMNQRAPAADWKQEWAPSSTSNSNNSHNRRASPDGGGSSTSSNVHRTISAGSDHGNSVGIYAQQYQQQHQRTTHLPSSYITELSQPPSVVLPVANGIPSPPLPFQSHYQQHQQGGGYRQHFPGPPIPPVAAFERWGDPNNSMRSSIAYHPGGGSSSGGATTEKRRHSGDGRSGGYHQGGNLSSHDGRTGDRWSSGGGGSERYYSGGHGGGGRYVSGGGGGGGGYGSPAGPRSHHRNDRHRHSYDRYAAGSDSAGRQGDGRYPDINLRGYGY